MIEAMLGLAALVLGLGASPQGQPITYTGYWLTDVSLGGQHYPGAQVYLSFRGHRATVRPFTDGSAHGFRNDAGTGRVRIVSGHRTITALLDPNQIYTFFDVANSSIGFGSSVGGRGYPLAVTALADNFGLVENSTIGAVSDIMRTPADATLYTPATATLQTDLTNETALSGGASSCVRFDPTTSICSNLTPLALKTDRGDLLVFEPYTVDEGLKPGTPQPYSPNWGFFWSTLSSEDDS